LELAHSFRFLSPPRLSAPRGTGRHRRSHLVGRGVQSQAVVHRPEVGRNPVPSPVNLDGESVDDGDDWRLAFVRVGQKSGTVCALVCVVFLSPAL
jgi:hypothetical protein